MKIIFDAEDFKNKPRGMVKTTLCLYRACLEITPSLKFTGLTRKPLAAVLPDDIALDMVRIRPNLPRSVWRSVMYNAYLALHACDAVHFPSNGLIPRIYPRRKIVMTLHDVLPLIIPGHFKSADKMKRYIKRRQHDLDRSDLVFTVSEHSKKDILKHFRVRKEPVVLYNAPTLGPAVQDPVYDLDRAGDYFFYCGGYDRRKGLDPLIALFLGLHREKKTTARLYLAGVSSYYSDEFKTLLEQALTAGVVKELGYVSDGDMIRFMRSAKGLIYPSSYEGFGLPPVEAMNAGCPVITTPYSSIPEVCGEAALFVRPDRGKEFADAVLALDRNGALRKELIVKGKKQVEKFSWKKSAALFLDHIAHLGSLSK